MEKRTINEELLAERVGTVVIRWSSLEGTLKRFVYDLAIYTSAALEDDDAFQVLLVLFGNMEMRQATANAKALAYHVNDIPDFYDRAERLLNLVDNDLRNERHRYVHDIWRIWGPAIYRIKSGAVVRREPPSGDRKLHHRTMKQYLGTHELVELADEIRRVDQELEKLGDELRERLNEIRPQPE